MYPILSTLRSVLETLVIITLQIRNRILSGWRLLRHLPLKERLLAIAIAIPVMVRQYSKIFSTYAARRWHTPIADQATKTCEQLQEQQYRAIRRGTLTEDEKRTSDTQIAHLILESVFDNVTIQHISTFAPRMGLHQLNEGTPVFKLGLKPEDVINLMQQRISSLCISYKHTRRSNDGLPKDIARIQKAVTEAARQLSQNRLLFWCDVIGHTPCGVSWAKQGIDLYLCMPTLQIISRELREEINDSFWMNIERLCAQCRGGLLSYDEDEAMLQFGPSDQGYFIHIPDLSYSLEFEKIFVAKLMCNPILYYRRARCEADKLEVMNYAVSSLSSVEMKLYQLQQVEAGLLKVDSLTSFLEFMSLVIVERDVDIDFISAYLDRPQGEKIIEDGEHWHEIEESFPASKVFESQFLEAGNRAFREDSFYIRRVCPSVDNVTDVISAPLWNGGWCSALRLRVDGFEEHEDHITGRVMSFRLATEEEELSLTYEASIRKRICFD